MAKCARLLIEQSGFEPWKRTLYYVLGQVSLLSQCRDLFPDAQIGTTKLNGRQPCKGLASHPEGSRNTPSCFMLKKLGLPPA